MRLVRILNYFEYSKEEAKKILTKELGWIDYGGHHFESIFTRFFQSYLAPNKFIMDRRMISLSAQIRAGQMSRNEALAKINQPPYSMDKILEDKNYIAKKFRLSAEEFDQILSRAPRTFLDYPSYYSIIKWIKPLVRWAARHHFLSGFFQGGIFR